MEQAGALPATMKDDGSGVLELLLVGAGPQNLCLLTRLLEPAGAAVDAVRRPPSSKRAVDARAARQRACREYRAAMGAWLAKHVAVVDERGGWMDRWCAPPPRPRGACQQHRA